MHSVLHSKTAKAIDIIIMTKREIVVMLQIFLLAFYLVFFLGCEGDLEYFLGNHKEAGQFRGRTEFISSANLLDSCLLYKINI